MADDEIADDSTKKKSSRGSFLSSPRELAAASKKASEEIRKGAAHAKENVIAAKDKAKAKVLEKALHQAGQKFLGVLTKDPWMPKSVKDSIVVSFRYIWPEVEDILFDLLTEDGPRKIKDRRPWPEEPPDRATQPLRWFRARILYAIFPADATFWFKARHPPLLLIAFLLVCPYFGISTIMWFLLLVFIDWDCDFQLINYIVLQRATIFITVGVLWSVKGFLGFAVCINESLLQPDACDLHGPGISQSALLKFAQTFFRASYAYVAYSVLIARRTNSIAAQRGSTELLPKWVKFVTWVSYIKRQHMGEIKEEMPNYKHVPSPAEDALAGSFVYGIGLGAVLSLVAIIFKGFFLSSSISQWQEENNIAPA